MYYGNAKDPIKFLIDTGSNKNFIHPKYTNIAHELEQPFYVSSVGGDIKIDKYSQGKLFKPYLEDNIKFYQLQSTWSKSDQNKKRTFEKSSKKRAGSIIKAIPGLISTSRREITFHN